MSFRQEIADKLSGVFNASGLAAHMNDLHKTILMKATRCIMEPENELVGKDYDKYLLNNVGPAAAESAIEHAITICRNQGHYSNISFNGSVVHNAQLIMNEPMEGYQNFSSVLRQFLLPRYAYLDFDTVTDPRHRIDQECGYPKFITPIMYRYMYDRDDMARRVVDIYPDETWSVDPQVYENEDEDVPLTQFEKDWQSLVDNYDVLGYLYRLDRLAGIGHYGALLLGVDDGEDLEKPIDEVALLAGMKRSVGTKQRNLLYMRPFDEYLSFIHMYETDVMHPRYGLPKFYNLIFLDMTIDAAGASIGTRLNRRVHWSRVVHCADNLQSSLVFGIPRMQPVFNRLLDLRKIKGASAEMFWNGGFPGVSFEIDPRFVTDNPQFNDKEFKEEVEAYSTGLQRYLRLIGISAKSLQPNIAEQPGNYSKLQMEAIACNLGIPIRIFMGAEEARLASSQEKLTWNQRLGRKLKRFTEPKLLRNFIDRMVAIGIVHPPDSGKYFVTWDDLNTATDEDKANLGLKLTQALSQYVSTGVIHLIQPMDYLTLILGMRPSQAKRVVASIEKNGGWNKLLAVDPSQGAGINGKAENQVSKGQREGTSRERPDERNTSDKQIEGMAS